MNKAREERIRARLLEERERLLAQRASLAERVAVGRGNGPELADYDVNHPADGGSELFEREKDQALYDNIGVLLARIDAALARLDEGTYGICEVCGCRIPEARLRAVPDAVMCVTCQSRYER